MARKTTWLRPARLASYRAVSAVRMTDCASAAEPGSNTVTPKLAVKRISAPADCTLSLLMANRSLSAWLAAFNGLHPGSTVRNSSPPMRPTASYGRIVADIILAASHSTWSPAR